jgi:GNAT superfamily N-acetyltransferase
MIDCLPLVPEREADFFAFFEGEAFADNPRWSGCYCQCFYEDHRVVNWATRSGAQNRACAKRRLAQGEMRGVLAYREGRVVGWCNAAPRPLLHALDEEPLADAETVGTILCFLVAPSARGQGIARALLAAACEQLAAEGLQRVQANPRPNAASPGAHHFGPLSLYLSAGFEIEREDADGSVWVSRRLQPRQ